MSNFEKHFAYIDGASAGNGGKSGIGFAIYDSKNNEIFFYSGKIDDCTNNEAEYRALIECCRKINELKIERVEILSDSQLVVNQVNGEWVINHEHLRRLCLEARHLLRIVISWNLSWIPREENARANYLAQNSIKDTAKPNIFTGKIEKIIDGKFLVYGTKIYCVDLENEACTCPAFVNRTTVPCKHMISCRDINSSELKENISNGSDNPECKKVIADSIAPVRSSFADLSVKTLKDILDNQIQAPEEAHKMVSDRPWDFV